MRVDSLLWIISALAIVLPPFAFYWGRRSLRKSVANRLDSLRDLSADFSGSVEQVASVSIDIATASREQLDTLTSTVAASHEIRSMIEKTSDSTRSLHERASQLLDLAQSGNQAVQEMVSSSQETKSGMEHFGKEMQESMRQLEQVVVVIREIADKTKVINEIVFQTKLLSFNASVEAARAGEHGKGFAVVAEEIGKLAQMSGGAADQISQIVEKSVDVVNETIQSTRGKINSLTGEIARKSESGYENAKSCERVFGQMTGEIRETSAMVEHISVAASEQAQGVSQLDRSVQEFQEAADRNRLVASQGTEHSHEFKKQTQTLVKIVSELGDALSSGNKNDGRQRLKKFVWNSKLELGVSRMDDEHKILVEKINILVSRLEEQHVAKDKKALETAFGDLADYTAEHFSDEEKFMESIGYPQLQSHRRIHENLLKQVGAFGAQIRNGTLDDSKLVSFLRNWLISHIMGVDMQYAEHSRSHGGSVRSRAA